MNGSEVVTRSAKPTPFGQAPELSDQEKMDLVAGDNTPFANAMYKLMENRIFLAQREAMTADPANEKQQVAKLTIAHAMDKFYTDVRDMINFEKQSHIMDIKTRAAQKQLEEEGVMEEIIAANARGEI
jgi:hypothetical protein